MKSRPKRFNLEKLKDPPIADMFEVTIGGKFATLNLLEENIDNLTENIHVVLIDIASYLLGKARKPERRRNHGSLMTLWISVTGKEASRK